MVAGYPLKRKWVSLGDQTKNVQFALDKGIPIVLRTFSVWSDTILLCQEGKWQGKNENVFNSEQKSW